MSQPPGFINTRFPTHVCKLNKAIYGLKKAARAWYTKLGHALLGWGFQASRADNSMFFLHTAKDVLILLIYVDDILVTGSDPHHVFSFASHLNATCSLRSWSFSLFSGSRDYGSIKLGPFKSTQICPRSSSKYQYV